MLVIIDPLNFSSNMDSLNWYRESELKHGRLAMLATLGWVISELHNSLASTLGVDSIVGSNDQVPLVLNGGLDKVNPFFWLVSRPYYDSWQLKKVTIVNLVVLVWSRSIKWKKYGGKILCPRIRNI